MHNSSSTYREQGISFCLASNRPHEALVTQDIPHILYRTHIHHIFILPHPDRQIDQPLPWRTKLPQPHATLRKDTRRLRIYHIPLIIHDLADAHLRDLDTARQTWTRIAIEDARGTDAVAARFEERVFLGVQAEAGGEVDAAFCGGVAAGAYRGQSCLKRLNDRAEGRTSAVAAVGHAAGRPVVSRANNALLPHNNTADTALHAVAAVGSEVRELHEVLVPGGPEAGVVGEVEGPQRGVQRGLRGGGVEQLELGALEEDL